MSAQPAMNLQLIDWLRNADYEPTSYSGRFMFGQECVAVVCDSVGEVLVDVVAEAMADGVNQRHRKEVLRKWRQDEMGLQKVIYWPDQEWPKKLVSPPEVVEEE